MTLVSASQYPINQPQVSRLSHGQLTGFSIDKLISFLILLNQDIEVNIKPHSKNIGPNNFDNHFSLNYKAY
ncbi:MAG: XRE family transcriptional regulator [Tatlockia sp.]|nr:XRE family transcriptional regulator [Tatlockia sp.]